ncbi:MAG: hypothetical protein ABI864_05300 [Chloroflexota bacterium]
MRQGSESIFQAGSQSGPELDIELVASSARIGGTINLGAYSRLSDLLNFHDEILTVAAGAVMGPAGERSGSVGLPLDVRLSELTLVIDRSDYVPPADTEQVIAKLEHKMLVVTDAYVITATFFIYAGAEAVPYLRASEPRWIPITDVNVRSLTDRDIEFGAKFAVLHRKPLLATSVF